VPAPPPRSAPAPLPLPAPTSGQQPAAASLPRPALPEPAAQVAPIVKDALARFVAWAHDHPGAPCPDAAILGAPDDPWGHPLAITCTDQPGDEIAGAISVGPDSRRGTADDIASWQLGPDVTDLVHGERWAGVPQRSAKPIGSAKLRPAAPAPARPGVATKPAPADVTTKPAPAEAPAKPAPAEAPAKPAPDMPLDENGLPVTR
jgi:hypothetical protein